MAKDTTKDYDHTEDEFYEVMPYTQGYTYHDDWIKPTETDDYESTPGKTTAIITLIVVGVVTVALGLLLIRGLQIVRDTANPNPATSGF